MSRKEQKPQKAVAAKQPTRQKLVEAAHALIWANSYAHVSVDDICRAAVEQRRPLVDLLAENAETEYIAYVSEQNLVPDASDEPLRHPQIGELFADDGNGKYRARFLQAH